LIAKCRRYCWEISRNPTVDDRSKHWCKITLGFGGRQDPAFFVANMTEILGHELSTTVIKSTILTDGLDIELFLEKIKFKSKSLSEQCGEVWFFEISFSYSLHFAFRIAVHCFATVPHSVTFDRNQITVNAAVRQ
jgi:hypothetical protein